MLIPFDGEVVNPDLTLRWLECNDHKSFDIYFGNKKNDLSLYKEYVKQNYYEFEDVLTVG